ncbi:hypothetical protein EVAR_76479_1 [Eumeta japonica]|uniref:Uncharacterized protein n=1 Tax=Eumeta variegata TaxID=151549 RepID=A0A4C1T4U9_EUMVA|nr:hypothetical protein EVAR_76479_1 [Eumeta japonica]
MWTGREKIRKERWRTGTLVDDRKRKNKDTLVNNCAAALSTPRRSAVAAHEPFTLIDIDRSRTCFKIQTPRPLGHCRSTINTFNLKLEDSGRI